MERAPPPAPIGPANHQDTMRRVFISMAGRRLLPKEAWSLNRAIHDAAAPTVRVYMKAGRTSCAIVSGLLDDFARRLVVELTMEGDFTRIQERPLSLPPSLVRLQLNGFRGELGPAPVGLRELSLRAYRFGKGKAVIPHPLLKDLTDGNAVQCFIQEVSEIVGALLPTLTHLVLIGLRQEDSGNLISLRSCVQTLSQLPHPHLENLFLCCFKVRWEDLLPLLSPAVLEVMIQFCLLESPVVSDMSTVPPLPEGLSVLVVNVCYCDSNVLAFSTLPESLRHLDIMMSPTEVRFQEPLPRGLETLFGDASVSGGTLPAGLRELQLLKFPQLNQVPPSLRVLKLHAYEHQLPQLPDTLETLLLEECTHHVADIPDSLRSLSLYWQPPEPAPSLPARWPAHLERLVYWGKYKDVGELAGAEMPRIKRLPSTLKELHLNGCEVHTGLPQTLREVRLGSAFTQRLTFTGRVTVNI